MKLHKQQRERRNCIPKMEGGDEKERVEGDKGVWEE